jgi:LysR family transcriptional regulator, low CO2-responsive transcriptional regulator
MEEFFREHRFEARIGMEMSSNETIKQAVMAGLGISFLSLHTLGLELRNALLRVVEVEGTPVIRTWNVVHLRSKALSPAAEAFRRFILKHGEAFLREQDAPLLGAGSGLSRNQNDGSTSA